MATVEERDKRVVFVFPGQGSQAVGMLGDLAAIAPEIEQTWREANDALGQDLHRLVREGPTQELDRTVNTQPALLAAGVAVWRAWRARGGAEPVALAGHSLGEYTALVCADALGFPEALRLVRRRAELMQQAVREGTGLMAAVLGAEPGLVAEACREASGEGVVEAANDNAPGQIVIAGERPAVERALAWLAERGVRKAVRLPVSVPSHCALMRPAAEAFAADLARVAWRRPRIPVIHNATAAPAGDPAELPRLLAEQLHRPVRWRECVEALATRGGRVGECGPGRVLAGLVRRIRPELEVRALGEREAFEQALAVWA